MSTESNNGHAPVSLRLVSEGLAHACDRFDRARTKHGPGPAFQGAFEALGWIAALDEGLGFPEGLAELAGLRYVRNRLQHQLADALFLTTDGAEFPITFPATFFEWRWKQVVDLPPDRGTAPDRRLREAYEAHLAGRPARLAIFHARHFLAERVAEKLVPKG